MPCVHRQVGRLKAWQTCANTCNGVGAALFHPKDGNEVDSGASAHCGRVVTLVRAAVRAIQLVSLLHHQECGSIRGVISASLFPSII